jgi:hypothetical protein
MSIDFSATIDSGIVERIGGLTKWTDADDGQPPDWDELDDDPYSDMRALYGDVDGNEGEGDQFGCEIYELGETMLGETGAYGPLAIYYAAEAKLARTLFDQGVAVADIIAELKDRQPPLTNEDLLASEIIRKVRGRTGDWPRSVAGTLFVDDPEHGICYFDKRRVDSFFGWLRSAHRVNWKNAGAARGELVSELERTVERYNAVELLPHEPKIAGIYYRGRTPEAGDGTYLQQLVARFYPDTTVDGDLIKAAFMTPMWGGPPGKRPIITITSDAGRGIGKSTLVEVISYLYGGHFDVSPGSDIEQLKTRMLTPSAGTIRIAVIDNVKSMKMSWAELEAMVTAPVISGRKNYHGEGQRPNLITWFVTVNGPAMATDLAQRSAIIKLARAEYDGTWVADTYKFIDTHRNEIIGDIIGALRAEPFPLAKHSRWAGWEADVLCRLPEPGEAQRLILERQGEANVELDEVEVIEEFISNELERLGYDPFTVQVRIPVAFMAKWYKEAIGDSKISTTGASRNLRQKISEGQIKRLSNDRSRTHGRCFIGAGEEADPSRKS